MLITQSAARPPARASTPASSTRCRLARHRAPARHRPPGASTRTHRLRHLHLGLHRPPKAVTVTHFNIAHKISTLATELGVDENFRTALIISCAFDASIEQLLLPLIGGGAAIVIDDEVRDLPKDFWQASSRIA